MRQKHTHSTHPEVLHFSFFFPFILPPSLSNICRWFDRFCLALQYFSPHFIFFLLFLSCCTLTQAAAAPCTARCTRHTEMGNWAKLKRIFCVRCATRTNFQFGGQFTASNNNQKGGHPVQFSDISYERAFVCAGRCIYWVRAAGGKCMCAADVAAAAATDGNAKVSKTGHRICHRSSVTRRVDNDRIMLCAVFCLHLLLLGTHMYIIMGCSSKHVRCGTYSAA